MIVTAAIPTVRRVVSRWRRHGRRVAFVPTMGAIHRGHLSLVRRARAAADRVVVSIFVNPLQFGPSEDYARYPRPARRDRRLLRAAGVDLLWRPPVRRLYPPRHRTRVRVEGLSDVLEGAVRPDHFEGVTTVVAKLLNVVQPHVLWLGQKDAQQVRVVEQMVEDLDVPVAVRRAPIVREPDGLALSSRNAYLSPEARRQAVALVRGLDAARALLVSGVRSSARLRDAIRRVWRRYPAVREGSVAIVDAHTLRPVRAVRSRILVAVAAHVGGARLIDNFEWSPR
ncbi:MAG: pantoate--beta-alanine ligase [Candidatus Eisenbacteria bacterium]|uniref:Pantothenate synthetase n=1 Tax=Eiseniibacteriota bacterium TaxID=2212470 RepID=A0A538U1P8_UNCEI|nr:MAG: pantoate--beta-alanine ligase [Candidatus Eisenbacteria bacterium]